MDHFKNLITKPLANKINKSIALERRIDEWKKLHPKRYPNTIYLNNSAEYDHTKHYNSIIVFPPGGHVGDAEWKLQYFHNLNVICAINNNEEPMCASEYYIIIPPEKKHLDGKLQGYINGCEHIVDSLDMMQLELLKSYIDIHPFEVGEPLNDIYFLPEITATMLDWYLDGEKIAIHIKKYE